jgi:hypothetical protein
MRLQLVLYIAIFLIGITGGFYLALYLQSQIALLAGIAVLFAFLTWLGSGTDIIGLLRDWYKEKGAKVIFTIEHDPQGAFSIYASTLELITTSGERTNISRKYLKVGIRNSGGIVAKQSKATLQIIKAPTETRAPSPEAKTLYWDNGQIYQDIGINRPEYLHVVLSDSRLGTMIPATDNLFALVSTPDTVKMTPPNFIRAQDGLGRGEFEFKLVVTAESGETVEGTIRVNVTDNWRELSMEKAT